jgi:hypothetical protein
MNIGFRYSCHLAHVYAEDMTSNQPRVHSLLTAVCVACEFTIEHVDLASLPSTLHRCAMIQPTAPEQLHCLGPIAIQCCHTCANQHNSTCRSMLTSC